MSVVFDNIRTVGEENVNAISVDGSAVKARFDGREFGQQVIASEDGSAIIDLTLVLGGYDVANREYGVYQTFMFPEIHRKFIVGEDGTVDLLITFGDFLGVIAGKYAGQGYGLNNQPPIAPETASILVKNVDISLIMKINAATGIPIEDETLHVGWVSDDASFKYSMPDYANAWRAVKFDSLEQSGDGTVIVGMDGDDVIRGANQVDDVLRGESGDDVLYGHKGDDVLFGGAGDDILIGGKGADTLIGGAGNDALGGGRGRDEYIFATSAQGEAYGHDTVLRYESGEVLRFIDSSHNDFVITFEISDASGGGMDVIIKDGDNSVKLQSVDAGSSVRIIDQNAVEKEHVVSSAKVAAQFDGRAFGRQVIESGSGAPITHLTLEFGGYSVANRVDGIYQTFMFPEIHKQFDVGDDGTVDLLITFGDFLGVIAGKYAGQGYGLNNQPQIEVETASVLVKNFDGRFLYGEDGAVGNVAIYAATSLPYEDETLHAGWVATDDSYKFSMPDYANDWRDIKLESMALNSKGGGLVGTDDADTLDGDSGHDGLLGKGGDDTLIGGTGKDILLGGDGADTLLAGNDDDRLYGGAGDDLLDGGRGSNLLTGGAGADIFVFNEGNSRDRVIDFDFGTDKIQMTAKQKQAVDISINDEGNTVISLARAEMVLEGVNEELTSASFDIV